MIYRNEQKRKNREITEGIGSRIHVEAAAEKYFPAQFLCYTVLIQQCNKTVNLPFS